MAPLWFQKKPAQHDESAEDVAARLSSVTGDLEKATAELRALVSGLRAVHVVEPRGSNETEGPS